MNYYDELIENIDKLIQNKDFDNAKSLILNELNLAYVPRDVEDKLNEYLSIIKESTMTLKSLTDDEISEYLKGDYEHQLLAVDALCKRNLRDYIDVCNDFLSNKDKYINAKAILIDSLIRQEINYDFYYVNECSLLKFNPKELNVIENTDGFKKAYKIISDNYLKEPSKSNIGEQLLYKEALLSLPNEIDGQLVANKIIEYIDKAFSAN